MRADAFGLYFIFLSVSQVHSLMYSDGSLLVVIYTWTNSLSSQNWPAILGPWHVKAPVTRRPGWTLNSGLVHPSSYCRLAQGENKLARQ